MCRPLSQHRLRHGPALLSALTGGALLRLSGKTPFRVAFFFFSFLLVNNPLFSPLAQTSHLYSKVDQRCIGREEHSNRPSNLQTFIFIAGGIVILLVLVAGGCSGGRWFYLHYRPPTSSSSSSGSGSGGVVTAASMTVNERSPPSSPTPYPPYLSKADHHHDHQFQVVEVVNSVPPPPYTRSPSC